MTFKAVFTGARNKIKQTKPTKTNQPTRWFQLTKLGLPLTGILFTSLQNPNFLPHSFWHLKPSQQSCARALSCPTNTKSPAHSYLKGYIKTEFCSPAFFFSTSLPVLKKLRNLVVLGLLYGYQIWLKMVNSIKKIHTILHRKPSQSIFWAKRSQAEEKEPYEVTW